MVAVDIAEHADHGVCWHPVGLIERIEAWLTLGHRPHGTLSESLSYVL